MPATASAAAAPRSTRNQVCVVFFQFGQHAHGKRRGRANPFGPLVQVLARPGGDRDEPPVRFRGRHHGAPWPPSRSRNTWRADRYSPCPRGDAGAYLAFLASLGYPRAYHRPVRAQ